MGFIGPDGAKNRNAPTVSRTFVFACGSSVERERLRVALLNSPASALGLPSTRRAAQRSDLMTLRRLIEEWKYDPNLGSENAYGNSPLNLATLTTTQAAKAHGEHSDECEQGLAIVAYLLSHGADPYRKGSTAPRICNNKILRNKRIKNQKFNSFFLNKNTVCTRSRNTNDRIP